MGYPQLIHRPKTDSFGIYGVTDLNDHVIQFKSGLRYESYLQLLENFKEKHEHIGALFATMLMQLEKKGLFNLCDYPSSLVLNRDFSSWIPSFARRYYDETRRMLAANYIGYGDRILELSNSRNA